MHNINNKQSKVRIRSENKLTSGGMMSSSFDSIPSVGGYELPEATAPRILPAARVGTATAGSHPGAAHSSARSQAFPRSGLSCGRPRRNEPSSTGSGANAKWKKPSTAGSEVTLEEPLVRAHVGEAGGIGV